MTRLDSVGVPEGTTDEGASIVVFDPVCMPVTRKGGNTPPAQVAEGNSTTCASGVFVPMAEQKDNT